jgi:hypothetical protein
MEGLQHSIAKAFKEGDLGIRSAVCCFPALGLFLLCILIELFSFRYETIISPRSNSVKVWIYQVGVACFRWFKLEETTPEFCEF